jgi:hypothetical protein
MLRISGADQTTPIETQSGGAGTSSTISIPVSGTLSATKAYLSLVFAAVGDFTNQNITGYPTGYTVISETETTKTTQILFSLVEAPVFQRLIRPMGGILLRL